MKKYKRINRIPPYMFCNLDKIKNKLLKESREVIDLGVGDPDLPTPGLIIDAFRGDYQP